MASPCAVESYAYIEDLVELERRRPAGRADIPREAREVCTPLVKDEWARCLKSHPDNLFRSYIVEGIQHGFRIGFQYAKCRCKRAKRNMQSAYQNPEVIDRYLAKEVRLGRVAGPFASGRYPAVHISRFGTIPKPHQPGQFRLILDLSHPQGASVNDGIEPELCSLKYTSVSEAVRRVMAMDPGTHLTNIDIESAYRIMPVHPDDRSLAGDGVEGKELYQPGPAVRVTVRPQNFQHPCWILQSEGIESIHYLDDFLIFGPPDKEVCEKQLKEVEVVFRRLGVPIACHKTEGPARVITFLGIIIDLVAGILRLPEEKVARLSQTIREWGDRRSCTKRELLSLIGQLQHACCVVRPGRTFLRRMITLSTSAKEMHHHIRLNRGFRSDLLWWACFLPEWNGTSLMSSVVKGKGLQRLHLGHGGVGHSHHQASGFSCNGHSHGRECT